MPSPGWGQSKSVHDCPYNADHDPSYLENVMEPLARGEGVACFLAEDDDGDRAVVFMSHRLEDASGQDAMHGTSRMRASQAVWIQHAARVEAVGLGFRPVVG